MGALRFKLEPNGYFLDNNENYSAALWTPVRELR